jgi:hypothetical protein
MPLYGRSFLNTAGLGQPYDGVGAGSWEEGVYDFKDLPLPGAQEFYDAEAGATFSYDAGKEMLVSYDTVEMALRKVDYIAEEGLGGAMWWEISGDRQDESGIVASVSTMVYPRSKKTTKVLTSSRCTESWAAQTAQVSNRYSTGFCTRTRHSTTSGADRVSVPGLGSSPPARFLCIEYRLASGNLSLITVDGRREGALVAFGIHALGSVVIIRVIYLTSTTPAWCQAETTWREHERCPAEKWHGSNRKRAVFEALLFAAETILFPVSGPPIRPYCVFAVMPFQQTGSVLFSVGTGKFLDGEMSAQCNETYTLVIVVEFVWCPSA